MRAVVRADLEGIGGVDRDQACFRGWPEEFRSALRRQVPEPGVSKHP